MAVRYSYLNQQFNNCPELWDELKSFVATGDFTLGKPLVKFEKSFAELLGASHAIGVNSGTDAIKIALKALGVNPGDEVITAANTFVATVGAINEIGAVPVFVDVDETFCINVELIEAAITTKTRAIVPVHFTGYMAKMDRVMEIANAHKLVVVEDACQAILAEWKGKKSGTWGHAAAFSLHPLKNLNVWSDGGVIVTNDSKLEVQLRLLRNHGLSDRDTVSLLGFNSRLDTFQAVVGNWLLPQATQISNIRINNAAMLDTGFAQLKYIRIPERTPNMRIVFHLYIVYAERRDELLRFCIERGVEAKIHYPVPIYKQPAMGKIVNSQTFPVTDHQAKNIISFPCDQHLSEVQIKEIIQTVNDFYKDTSR
jgi:dTDP-4-amino-4,6-dideoxygalactose transaminase